MDRLKLQEVSSIAQKVGAEFCDEIEKLNSPEGFPSCVQAFFSQWENISPNKPYDKGAMRASFEELIDRPYVRGICSASKVFSSCNEGDLSQGAWEKLSALEGFISHDINHSISPYFLNDKNINSRELFLKEVRKAVRLRNMFLEAFWGIVNKELNLERVLPEFNNEIHPQEAINLILDSLVRRFSRTPSESIKFFLHQKESLSNDARVSTGFMLTLANILKNSAKIGKDLQMPIRIFQDMREGSEREVLRFKVNMEDENFPEDLKSNARCGLKIHEQKIEALDYKMNRNILFRRKLEEQGRMLNESMNIHIRVDELKNGYLAVQVVDTFDGYDLNAIMDSLEKVFAQSTDPLRILEDEVLSSEAREALRGFVIDKNPLQYFSVLGKLGEIIQLQRISGKINGTSETTSGLGLYGASKLISEEGGKIFLGKSFGYGAHFLILVPITPKKQAVSPELETEIISGKLWDVLLPTG